MYGLLSSITEGWLHSEDMGQLHSEHPPGQQEAEALEGPQANMSFRSVDDSLYITFTPCMDQALLPRPALGSHLAVSSHEELQLVAYSSKPGLPKPL